MESIKQKKSRKKKEKPPDEPKQNDVNDENLTPYQGRKRTFGNYNCSNCKRQWSSACAWANKAQECTNCSTKVYPFRQLKIIKRTISESEKDPFKGHIQKQCHKCEELSSYCPNVTYDSDCLLLP